MMKDKPVFLSILILGSIVYGFTLFKVCTRVFLGGRGSAAAHRSALSCDREEVDRLLRILDRAAPSEEITADLSAPFRDE